MSRHAKLIIPQLNSPTNYIWQLNSNRRIIIHRDRTYLGYVKQKSGQAQSVLQTAGYGMAQDHQQTQYDPRLHGNSTDTCTSDSAVVHPLGTDAGEHLLPICVSPYHTTASTFIRQCHQINLLWQKNLCKTK